MQEVEEEVKVLQEVGEVRVVPCLRLLTALEDVLGSLGPAVNQVLGRSLALEQGREGASQALLEDPDCVTVLHLAREKLAGLVAARLVAGAKEGAVRVCQESLARLLQGATTKRSSNIGSLISAGGSGGTGLAGANDQELEGARILMARSVASALIAAGRLDIGEEELERLVEQLCRETVEAVGGGVGQVAREHLQVIETGRKQQQEQQQYQVQQSLIRPQEGDQEQLEGLTMEELRSLLGNFRNLSKQEQVRDLVLFCS